jgi:hypothetical protein
MKEGDLTTREILQILGYNWTHAVMVILPVVFILGTMVIGITGTIYQDENLKALADDLQHDITVALTLYTAWFLVYTSKTCRRWRQAPRQGLKRAFMKED